MKNIEITIANNYKEVKAIEQRSIKESLRKAVENCNNLNGFRVSEHIGSNIQAFVFVDGKQLKN